MKLFFLYGPPAVGKLTIAKLLAEKTGYPLLHNHLLVNPIAEIFPFENPANRLLVREFRLRILQEAAKNEISLIATFGIAGNAPFHHIRDVVHTIESHKGEVCLVHLTADAQVLLHRVESDSRKAHGKQLSQQKLSILLQDNNDLFDTYAYREHLTIDTSRISPEESVEEIIRYYI